MVKRRLERFDSFSNRSVVCVSLSITDEVAPCVESLVKEKKGYQDEETRIR